MKLVNPTGDIALRVGDEAAVRMIAAAGFDGYDYSCNNGDKFFEAPLGGMLARAKRVKRAADACGLPCLQSHAPYFWMAAPGDDETYPSERTPEHYAAVAVNCLYFMAELECDRMVVHPGAYYTPEENRDRLYGKILPTAEKLGITVLTENCYYYRDKTYTEFVPTACGTIADFIAHIDLINNKYFKGCLDVGHASMQNSEGAAKMIRAIGAGRIAAVHIQDTDLIGDNHTFPFCGKQDWDDIMAALGEIGYTGHFTFEADSFFRRYPTELLPACLTLLEKTGRYLIAKLSCKLPNKNK
ncbi:MAG: sugar phosphate isomerase/epimerase [Clostridiales bacterium]|jgi:sugar phosphate isomerase/epimerase|nr:sugar phosphate isomerase/epimerase [Clostridiales bacterium]